MCTNADEIGSPRHRAEGKRSHASSLGRMQGAAWMSEKRDNVIPAYPLFQSHSKNMPRPPQLCEPGAVCRAWRLVLLADGGMGVVVLASESLFDRSPLKWKYIQGSYGGFAVDFSPWIFHPPKNHPPSAFRCYEEDSCRHHWLWQDFPFSRHARRGPTQC